MNRGKAMKAALAGAVGSILIASAAMAADLPPPVVAPAPPPPMAAPAFDWGGVYYGVYGGYNTGIPPGAAGVLVGYNFVRGNFLGGVEARLGGFFPGLGPTGFDFEGSVNARVGFLLRDRLNIYGVAGIGHVFCCDFTYWSAGGGLEIAAGSRVSLFAEGRAFNDFTGLGPPGLMIRGGVNLHR